MSSYQLGIDIGTTFTAAAVHSEGVSRMLSLGADKAEMPSVVAVQSNGLLIGDAASRRALTDPLEIAREFKRRIGDPTPLVVGGQAWSAGALTAAIAQHVVQLASSVEGQPPAGITITHPADWRGYKIGSLKDALGNLENLGVFRTVSEPIAAASHYRALGRIKDGALVAAFDLGGGTFDAVLVRAQGAQLAVSGKPQGLEYFGGIDLDYALFSHVLEVTGTDLGGLEDTRLNRQAVARLRDDCRQAKENLSADTSTTVPVMLPGLHTEVRINRSEFESLIAQPLGKAISVMSDVLEQADASAGDLAGVLLVGGGSRIPLVAQMLTDRLGMHVLSDAHPKHSVALGAAQLASLQEETPRRTKRQGKLYRLSEPGIVDRVGPTELGSDQLEEPAQAPHAATRFVRASDVADWAGRDLSDSPLSDEDQSIRAGESIRSWADRLWPSEPQTRHGSEMTTES